MGLEHLLNVIEFLVPIAKAIPILGSPVEGSLEAVKQIVLLAQVRRQAPLVISGSSAGTGRQEP
jgi:hypothetical protein